MQATFYSLTEYNNIFCYYAVEVKSALEIVASTNYLNTGHRIAIEPVEDSCITIFIKAPGL